jgi:hypothetical protein
MAMRCFVLAVCLSVVRDGPCASWDLRTDDTEMRIGVVSDRVVVERLAAVGAARNWFGARSVVPLMSHVWCDGLHVPLTWEFQGGAWDAVLGQLTLTFANADPTLTLRSVWRARKGRGPVEHSLELDNRSAGRVTVAEEPEFRNVVISMLVTQPSVVLPRIEPAKQP